MFQAFMIFRQRQGSSCVQVMSRAIRSTAIGTLTGSTSRTESANRVECFYCATKPNTCPSCRNGDKRPFLDDQDILLIIKIQSQSDIRSLHIVERSNDVWQTNNNPQSP